MARPRTPKTEKQPRVAQSAFPIHTENGDPLIGVILSHVSGKRVRAGKTSEYRLRVLQLSIRFTESLYREIMNFAKPGTLVLPVTRLNGQPFSPDDDEEYKISPTEGLIGKNAGETHAGVFPHTDVHLKLVDEDNNLVLTSPARLSKGYTIHLVTPKGARMVCSLAIRMRPEEAQKIENIIGRPVRLHVAPASLLKNLEPTVADPGSPQGWLIEPVTQMAATVPGVKRVKAKPPADEIPAEKRLRNASNET